MREIVTEIRIQASADTVWSILTDFGSYHNWNPFIQQAKGKAIVGQRLENRPKVSKGRGVVFRPVVTKVVPGRELRWYGHLLIPGLSDGEHIFEIESSSRKACASFIDKHSKAFWSPYSGPSWGERPALVLSK